MAWKDFAARVPALLTQMQADLLAKAKAVRDSSVATVTEWKVRAASGQRGEGRRCGGAGPFPNGVWEHGVLGN